MTWTRTADRLPDHAESVLVWDGTEVIPGHWDASDEQWRDYTAWPFEPGAVTHWMPMPEPPNDQTDVTGSSEPWRMP